MNISFVYIYIYYKIFTFFESYREFDLTHEDEIISRTTIRCLSYTANAMPADALATLGARASASMVLTLKASEELTKYECLWDLPQCLPKFGRQVVNLGESAANFACSWGYEDHKLPSVMALDLAFSHKS